MKTVFAMIVPRRRCVLNTPTALALTQTHVHLALVHIFERPVRPDDLAAVQSVYAADTNLNAHECTERRIVPEKLAHQTIPWSMCSPCITRLDRSRARSIGVRTSVSASAALTKFSISNILGPSGGSDTTRMLNDG